MHVKQNKNSIKNKVRVQLELETKSQKGNKTNLIVEIITLE